MLTAESGLVRKNVLLFSSVWAATTLIVARWPSPDDGADWAGFWAWLFGLALVGECIPLLWFLRFFLVLSAYMGSVSVCPSGVAGDDCELVGDSGLRGCSGLAIRPPGVLSGPARESVLL